MHSRFGVGGHILLCDQKTWSTRHGKFKSFCSLYYRFDSKKRLRWQDWRGRLRREEVMIDVDSKESFSKELENLIIAFW